MATREHSAVGLTRYAVMAGTSVTVAEGLCMTVNRGFLVRGFLVLRGILKVV